MMLYIRIVGWESHGLSSTMKHRRRSGYIIMWKNNAVMNYDLSDILDRPLESFITRQELEPNIWNPYEGGYRLDPGVRSKIIDATKHFIKLLGLGKMGMPSIPINDIVFTGSLANYNWSEYSDIDVHIIVDLSNINPDYLELIQSYFHLIKKKFDDEHNITIHGYEVEMYMEDSATGHIATGVYSIKNDQWVKIPTPGHIKPDLPAIRRKAGAYMSTIDMLERSMLHPGADIQKLHILAKDTWDRIKELRRAGLSQEGESSTENLAFKLLRRNGYIGKLIDVKTKLIDRKLSL